MNTEQRTNQLMLWWQVRAPFGRVMCALHFIWNREKNAEEWVRLCIICAVYTTFDVHAMQIKHGSMLDKRVQWWTIRNNKKRQQTTQPNRTISEHFTFLCGVPRRTSKVCWLMMEIELWLLSRHPTLATADIQPFQNAEAIQTETPAVAFHRIFAKSAKVYRTELEWIETVEIGARPSSSSSSELGENF